MNPKHITSLELSKQLWEAGIKIESEFWWVEELRPGIVYPNPMEYMWNISHKSMSSEGRKKDGYPAPLATELLEIMPDHPIKKIEDKSLPNALAKMLLYLQSNNLLPKPEGEKV